MIKERSIQKRPKLAGPPPSPGRPKKSKEEKAQDFLDSQFEEDEEELRKLTTNVPLISTTRNKLNWMTDYGKHHSLYE